MGTVHPLGVRHARRVRLPQDPWLRAKDSVEDSDHTQVSRIRDHARAAVDESPRSAPARRAAGSRPWCEGRVHQGLDFCARMLRVPDRVQPETEEGYATARSCSCCCHMGVALLPFSTAARLLWSAFDWNGDLHHHAHCTNRYSWQLRWRAASFPWLCSSARPWIFQLSRLGHANVGCLARSYSSRVARHGSCRVVDDGYGARRNHPCRSRF